MNRRSLYFTEPETIEIREETLNQPGRDQLLVETQSTAISPGSELLLYRGNIPSDMPQDPILEAYSGTFEYPLKYGYACIGKVVDVGRTVAPTWIGKSVFAFHPHESHFLATESEIIPIPDEIDAEDALFMPNMETAVSFVMDGQPMIGESVAVIGQGVVGLLTTALLKQYPLKQVVTFDLYKNRRENSEDFGASKSLDPEEKNFQKKYQSLFSRDGEFAGADLVFEISGSPDALNLAMQLAGFESRLVIGSWYGSKTAEINLGESFHRNHLQIISSQVSRIASKFSGRWSKSRRFEVVESMLKQIQPSKLITHRISFEEAGEAFELLSNKPDEAIQVVLEY